MQRRARAWGAGAQEARGNGPRYGALSQAQGIQDIQSIQDAVRTTHPITGITSERHSMVILPRNQSWRK